MTDEATLAGLRPLMFSIAYRMTGHVSDAEDIAQEAIARLVRVERDGGTVDEPRAWLSAVTTRIAIDHLRSARVTREAYVGPWLPEPLLVDEQPGPGQRAEMSDSLSQAFLVVLERLAPVERAVFLLHEVFGVGYDEIAESVGRSAATCRQIAHRAREHVEARRPRFTADRAQREELFDRFLAAAEQGDLAGLTDLLAADVIVCDGRRRQGLCRAQAALRRRPGRPLHGGGHAQAAEARGPRGAPGLGQRAARSHDRAGPTGPCSTC